MRNFLKIFLLAALGVAFNACQKEGYGEFSLSVKSAGPDYVEVMVTAPNTMEMAYLITEEPDLLTPTMVFRKGEVITVNPGQIVKLGSNLNENTKHYLYAAGRMGDEDVTKLIELTFKTKSYKFNEVLTLMETYYDGFKMHITVPAEVKKRGNAMAYGYGSLALYNMAMFNSRQDGESWVELESIGSGSTANGDYCLNDTTVVINSQNEVLYDEYGDYVFDEYTGEIVTLHDPYTPGEPIMFLTAESHYGTPDEWAYVMGYHQPTKNVWTIPNFDVTTGSWAGPFEKTSFRINEPELCDATISVSYPEDGQGINDWKVRFEVEGDFSQYAFMVLNQMAWDEIMTIYLNHDESLMQWFVVSWLAANWYYPYYSNESPLTVPVAQNFFTEPLNGGETYYVVATLLGDEEGKTQRFLYDEFTTLPRTKPAPVIEVTALDPGDVPFMVGFNIKAGEDMDGNIQEIKGAYWACEYAREWEKYLNAKYTYEDIIKSSNMTFTSEELKKINSSEGLDVWFDSLDGEVTRFAAYGCNDEYAFNIISKAEAAAWADCEAPMYEGSKASVSSPYFTTLLGDWTATATMDMNYEKEDGTVGTMTKKQTAKITVSDKAPALAEKLDPSVYALYGSKQPAEVDGMYEELKELTDRFTDYRLERQNRLLCTGYFDFDPMRSEIYPTGRLDYRSPYDLFVATDYSSVDVPQAIYDFGPKWFLEVLEDGSVIVPFSSIYQPPVTAWPGYPFYLGGVNAGSENMVAFYEATEDVPGFPVEISADGNTMTIKPIVIEKAQASTYLPAGTYYMNAIGIQPMSEGLEIIGKLKTDIVLTRGWNGTATKSVENAVPRKVQAASLDGTCVTALPEVRKVKSMTKLEPKTEKVGEPVGVVTAEMVRKSVEDLSKVKFMRYGNVK